MHRYALQNSAEPSYCRILPSAELQDFFPRAVHHTRVGSSPPGFLVGVKAMSKAKNKRTPCARGTTQAMQAEVMPAKLDPLLRNKQVLAATSLSKTSFYLLRASGEFPLPDGFLNKGQTPVWRTSTVVAWIDAQLISSRARGPTHRLA